jgi:hypothetical protein
MEAHAAGDVEIDIRVMDPVQPPQQRHLVEHHVLRVDRQIENEDRDDDGDPERRRQHVEQTPSLLRRQDSGAHRRNRQQEAEHECIDGDDAEVRRPALPARGRQPAARRVHLPQRHDRENAGEPAKAQTDLVGENKIRDNCKITHQLKT